MSPEVVHHVDLIWFCSDYYIILVELIILEVLWQGGGCLRGHDAVGAAAEVSQSNLQCSMWSTGDRCRPHCERLAHPFSFCPTTTSSSATATDQTILSTTVQAHARTNRWAAGVRVCLPAENKRDVSPRNTHNSLMRFKTQSHEVQKGLLDI